MMPDMPEGAQKSEDGYYWWDGAAWQPVSQGEQAQGGQAQAQGAPTKEEIDAITSPDQLTERLYPYFLPDYDKVPDDTSQAEVSAVLSDEPDPDAGEEESDG
jgi:hypothetical protein